MRTDGLLGKGALLLAILLAPPSLPLLAQSADSTTPPILDTEGKPLRGSIASLEPVVLGDVPQWISIRGRDVWNPVLLHLDRAPGVSDLAAGRHYAQELEKHFIVVHWDQRGAGKSFNPKQTGSLQLDRYVSDAIELASQLRGRFRQDKVYLVGNGFGALVAFMAAQQHPELFHALVAVAPMVNAARNEQVAYRFALDAAAQAGDAATLERLRAAGPPPYTGKDMFGKYAATREAAVRLAASMYPDNDYRRAGGAPPAEAPEYLPSERERLPQAEADVFATVYPQAARVNLAELVPSLGVPVYFVMGRHDRTTCATTVESYFTALQSPKKAFVWFEQSGVAPIYEEPGAFVQFMVSTVLSETFKRREATQ
jgi:pimeloyl-ACP methyl ester carboxylesterase